MKHRLLIALALCALPMVMLADEYSEEVVPASGNTIEAVHRGGGVFDLTAVPASGWTFVEWSDTHSTTATRTETVTSSSVAYDAKFEDHRCTLYGPKYPAPVGGGGTVSAAAGSCECDWILTATPASGWAFKEWTDGNTSNPRTVSVDPDEDEVSYTATFVPACVVNEPVIASVTGLGTSSVTVLCEGDCSWTLAVTAASGYTFMGWADDASAPAMRTVSSTASGVDTYTPVFERTCVVNKPVVPSSPYYTATVVEGATPCTWTITLSLTPASGYTFLGWDENGDGDPDGNTSLVLSDIPSGDDPAATLTPVFEQTCVVNKPLIAAATGMSTSSVTATGNDCEWRLTVTALENWEFTQWSDGNTSNPRVVTSGNDPAVTYTPVFEDRSCALYEDKYDNPDYGGSVAAVKDPLDDCRWTLTATPEEHYRFTGWSDAVITNPRVVTINPALDENVYTANFERIPCEYKDSYTSTGGGGTVAAVRTDECTCAWQLTATPTTGWTFQQWNDGNTDNPRTVNMSASTETFSAIFEDHRCTAYEAKVVNPVTGGTVTAVNGACECDWTLTATPTEGYAFLQWEDCDYTNPRTVTVDPDAGTQTYTAHFIASDAYIDSWTATDIVVATKTQDLTPTTATIYINGVAIDAAHTDQVPDPITGEHGMWTVPGGLNDHAGEQISIIFYDNTTGLPVSVVTGTVPYISTGDKSFNAILPPLPENTDVEVVSGTLTFDDDDPMVLGALTVYPDAKAVIPTGKDVTFTHIYMRGDGINHTYPQLVANGSIHNLNNDTIYYDYTLDYASFYPLAVPYDVKCEHIRTKTGRTASYEVQWYNSEDRAANAHAWNVFDDQAVGATLRAGTGYIVFAVPYKWNGTRHATVDVRFPMVVNLEFGEQVKSTHISEYGGEWTSPSNRNWNFIGSPYLANYRHHDDAALMEGTYEPGISTGDNEKYEYNNDGVRYITSSTDGFLTYTQTRVVDQDLVAFNSYFIQAAATGDLTFPLSQRAQNAPRRIRSTDVPQEIAFGIVLSGSNATDYTGLLYGETFTPDYELNADLVKVHGSSPTLALYSLAGTEERAFNALSLDAINQPVSLGYKHATAGLMTFAFDTAHYDASMLEAVMLTDYATGRVVNLLDEHYSFTTAGTEDNARFVINAVLAPRVTTGVDNRTVNSLQPDGVYDLLGRRVSPDMLQQGVYIIIENGQSRKEVIR